MTAPRPTSPSRGRVQRPGKAGRIAACAVAYVVAVHVVTWLTQGIGFTPDAFGYLEGVHLLAPGVPAYFPPGYPIFLAPWVAMFPGASGFAIVGFQHLCMVLTLLALRQMSRAFLGDALSALGLVVSASMGPTMFLPQSILSENAALFGMTGALWFASRGPTQRPLALELAAGACLALATLARVVPLPAMIVPLVLIQMSVCRARELIVRTLRILSIAVSAVVLAAAWNFARSGEFAITNSKGFHLYNRVIAEQGMLDRHGPATAELLARTGGRSLKGRPHWDVTPLLYKQGVSYHDAERLLGDAAIEGLRSDFSMFVRFSLYQAWREYRATPTMELRSFADRPLPVFEREPPASMRAPARSWWHLFSAIFATVWPFLAWAPLVGLVALPLLNGRWEFAAILAVPAGYLLATAQIEHFWDRYIVCVLPFALALVPAPIAALMNVSRSRLVRRATGLAAPARRGQS